MYKLKQLHNDFIVKERLNLKKESGDYYYFSMEKTKLTTEKAINKICNILKIPRRNIGYAGNKDKNAFECDTKNIWGNVVEGAWLLDILENISFNKISCNLEDLPEKVDRTLSSIYKNNSFWFPFLLLEEYLIFFSAPSIDSLKLIFIDVLTIFGAALTVSLASLELF